MPFWLQFLLFAIPGVLIYFGMYYSTPKLVEKNVPFIYAFWFNLWFPVLLLLPLALMLYVMGGGAFTGQAIIDRFRLTPFQASDWLWVLGAVILTVIFDQVLEPLGKYFARIRLFAPPSYLPAPFNPLKRMKLPPEEFFGVKLSGNWKILIVFIPIHILAMFSEEMMWRGFILPLQEEMFGGMAWVVNGMLWAWIVHAALKWHWVSMVPGMLIAPLVAQLTESTWASFAAHAIGNSPLWVLLFLGIIKKSQTKIHLTL